MRQLVPGPASKFGQAVGRRHARSRGFAPRPLVSTTKTREFARRLQYHAGLARRPKLTAITGCMRQFAGARDPELSDASGHQGDVSMTLPPR
jgi:hypothetical protein